MIVIELDNEGKPVPTEPPWVLDPVGATRYATTHPYQQGLPPHWHRCDYMRDGVRCAKGSGHETQGGKAAEHEAPKP